MSEITTLEPWYTTVAYAYALSERTRWFVRSAVRLSLFVRLVVRSFVRSTVRSFGSLFVRLEVRSFVWLGHWVV